LDVFEVEPLAETSPLWGLENALLTSHCVDLTAGYCENSVMVLKDRYDEFVKGVAFSDVVDKKSGY